MSMLEPAEEGEPRETILRSLCGPQPESTKESAPSWVFGTGDRSGSHITQSSSARRAVGLSPGPIYMPTGTGRIGEGVKFSFGSGGVANDNRRRAGAPPGPGEYDTPASIGDDQGLSTKSTAPRYGWGTGGRNKLAAGGVIGLAPRPYCQEFYELRQAIGEQPSSTKSTRPAFSLSVEPRFGDAQKTRQKAAAPGPGAYNAVCGSGTQVDSTKITQAQYGFSRGRRFRGPGADQTGVLVGELQSAVGSQVRSDRRSKPSYGFGTASRFSWDRPSSARAATPGPGAYNA